ncbi:MAG: DUF1961 family protein [Candidatus Hydrogenedentota bacterium]
MVAFDKPLGAQGTVAFTMMTDQAYYTGPEAKTHSIEILEVPGVAQVRFAQSRTVCELQWLWDRGVRAADFQVQVPRLPGPGAYFVQYTWDAPAGRLMGYVNGMPLRLTAEEDKPWAVPAVTEVHIAPGPFDTKLEAAHPNYLHESEARRAVPETFFEKHGDIFGSPKEEPAHIGTAAQEGALLHEASFTNSSSVEGWVMEGPGKTAFEDGWMTMASKKPDSLLKDGHIVYWCPEEFPASFIAEWEMEIRSEHGLCIVFFAARGEGGKNLFDSNLPERDGDFKQYTRDAVDCYHISYYANTPLREGRMTSNMRKNSGFYLVANGPPGIDPDSGTSHTLRLVKDGAHVQLRVDGRVIIDWTDDTNRYGPPHGSGKIGFRQMQWTVAGYRNMKVYELLDKP